MRTFWWLWNRIRGFGFDWTADDHPAGGYFAVRAGTCPYPTTNDWSAKGCIRRGDCGCSEGMK